VKKNNWRRLQEILAWKRDRRKGLTTPVGSAGRCSNLLVLMDPRKLELFYPGQTFDAVSRGDFVSRESASRFAESSMERRVISITRRCPSERGRPQICGGSGFPLRPVAASSTFSRATIRSGATRWRKYQSQSCKGSRGRPQFSQLKRRSRFRRINGCERGVAEDAFVNLTAIGWTASRNRGGGAGSDMVAACTGAACPFDRVESRSHSECTISNRSHTMYRGRSCSRNSGASPSPASVSWSFRRCSLSSEASVASANSKSGGLCF